MRGDRAKKSRKVEGYQLLKNRLNTKEVSERVGVTEKTLGK
jgi:hypothetical protein